jgi:microcystin-dependent protein
MSNCSNCYNGCTEIVSDRCVKYTGIDVPVLGIQTGDSLSFVEQALITFLVSTLDGTGVKIDLGTTMVCELVNKYLPTCGDLSIVDISKALIEAACDLQEQVDVIVADIVEINDQLNIIEADYTVRCLTVLTPSITPSSGTHAVLQATIDTLCALIASLPSTYVQLNDLDALIADYLDTVGYLTKYYNRMVPYTAVEYYGPIAGNFDGTGAGLLTGAFEKIYLCNGNNGTPDKRGVIGVGTSDGSMGGLTLPARTNPSTPGNPSYALNTVHGYNTTTLLVGQIPDHTHLATVVINDPKHKHIQGFGGINSLASYGVTASPIIANINTQSATGTANFPYTSEQATGLDGTNVLVTNSHVGGNGAHTNIQPVLPCYYIIYIP